MGDILDNFHANPKLAAKEAHNRMSISEALSVAQWLIAESGVKWDAHVLGNHDLWIGPEGRGASQGMGAPGQVQDVRLERAPDLPLGRRSE
jgi:hypothetical protein